MAALGNVIWFVLGGGIWALIWLLMAGIFAITIIGLPLARACLEFAKLAACPFGKEIIRDTELLGKNNVSAIAKTINTILGIIWFPLGLILTIAYFALAIACFVSIIGIPFGIAYVRIGKFVLFPMGARVVSKKQAYAIATANEMAKRTNTAEVQKAKVQSDNTQLAPAATFPKEKVIAAAAGVLVCFLLFRFLTINSPFFNRDVLALSIIAAIAIIFGGTVGGLIGPLGNILAFISFGLSLGNFFYYSIPYIISYGLFGLLAGTMCQKLALSNKENSILKNSVPVFFITYVLKILTDFIWFFISAVTLTVTNTLLNIKGIRDAEDLFSELGYFGVDAFKDYFSSYTQRGLLNSLKGGLVISILTSLSIFAWLKWRMKKDAAQVPDTTS